MPESDPISPNSPPDDADRTPALRKEPSFSRWCIDDATAPLPSETDADEEGGEGSDEFELPLLIDEADAKGERKRSEPFDVVSSVGESKAAGATISTVVVAKAVALILLWYTFSTFLTVYNKTLLGEKLGKFPAPMLMNTIHFALQAVASKAVLMVRRRKFGDEVVVNWRDYFFRVVPTALGTALDINLSNASTCIHLSNICYYGKQPAAQ